MGAYSVFKFEFVKFIGATDGVVVMFVLIFDGKRDCCCWVVVGFMLS